MGPKAEFFREFIRFGSVTRPLVPKKLCNSFFLFQIIRYYIVNENLKIMYTELGKNVGKPILQALQLPISEYLPNLMQLFFVIIL